MIHQILSYTAAVSGVVSAGLWWWAATVIVKKGDPKGAAGIFIGNMAIPATFQEQSKFNAWAAVATGIAAAASGLAQLFSN
jgi:hypothetical protein